MQAARGASLSPESGSDADTGPGGSRPARTRTASSRGRALLGFVLAAIVLYAVDQLTKVWAVAALTDAPDRQLVGDVLQLHLVRNPGAAFSTGTGYTEIFTGIAVLAVGVILWLSRRLHSLLWAVGLGVLLAGVAGNLTDRMLRSPGPLRGHVIDFLMLPSWPVFNVADMCINVAAVLILVQAFRGVRLDGSRVGDDQDEATSAEQSEQPAADGDHAVDAPGPEARAEEPAAAGEEPAGDRAQP